MTDVDPKPTPGAGYRASDFIQCAVSAVIDPLGGGSEPAANLLGAPTHRGPQPDPNLEPGLPDSIRFRCPAVAPPPLDQGSAGRRAAVPTGMPMLTPGPQLNAPWAPRGGDLADWATLAWSWSSIALSWCLRRD